MTREIFGRSLGLPPSAWTRLAIVTTVAGLMSALRALATRSVLLASSLNRSTICLRICSAEPFGSRS